MKQFLGRHFPRISSNPIISRLVWLCAFLILLCASLVIALSAQVTANAAAHRATIAAEQARRTSDCINQLLALAAPISAEDRRVQDKLISDEYAALTGPDQMVSQRLLMALSTYEHSRGVDDAHRAAIKFGGCH